MRILPPSMREDVRAHLPSTLADVALIESLPEDVQFAIARILKSGGMSVVDDSAVDAYKAGYEDGVEEILDQIPSNCGAPSTASVLKRLERLRKEARHAA